MPGGNGLDVVIESGLAPGLIVRANGDLLVTKATGTLLSWTVMNRPLVVPAEVGVPVIAEPTTVSPEGRPGIFQV